MYLIINIFGLLVFMALAVLFSKDRSAIKWRSVAVMSVFNLVLAWFLTDFSVGRSVVKGASNGFNELISVANQGIGFALNPQDSSAFHPTFITSVLLPILLVVPLFDILTYIGVLPFVIKWIGRGLAKLSGQPKFESFFSVEMMFLGNTEALAVSGLQLKTMNAQRNLTLAMMSMSCVTASIIGSYTQMMPGQYILTAVPINVVNALIVTAILNPVDVTPEEDVIATVGGEGVPAAENAESGSQELAEGEVAKAAKPEREPFFSFLGDSILGSGKLILIIAANVIAFVALAAMADKILGWVNPWLSLEHILGIIMFPFAWLMGVGGHSFDLAQFMGTKLITNEFVVMGEVTHKIKHFNEHYAAVLTVFLTSFANFSTIGMIIGCFKGLVDDQKSKLIAKNVGYLLLSGILVSLFSAAMVGLFVW
ncbi:NupC/NupG family nucleoside CNT transporter [Fructobacillus ficulneus]|uniref:CNT family concentrative nucleoside transporter n=1 Tax=Fructobacillus ficulneus TaxID=157463 RepID=A0A0K8MFF9_9LACO|nr:nucleoside transporter C-terminal domain-containing protein [Fructobacillus ficulneus]GAO99245.1 CNT family concentrative nucleoside transporter [Fructobacillus ficulneus]